MTDKTADFTQGSILKKLVAFMLPVLGALILQAAYGAVDLLVVGRFGSTSGLSAVSTGSQVLNLVTFVVVQFAMGITVLIARYLGEKKTGTDWLGHRRFCNCIYSDFSWIVHRHGLFRASNRDPDAGSCRSYRIDCCLHPYLRKWNLFYRRLQPAFCDFPWTRRQQVPSAFCTCRMHHKCFR